MSGREIEIRPIRESDIGGYHAVVGVVAREKRYLAMTDAPPLIGTRAFVIGNIRRGNPHLVAVDGADVVGWCDIVPSERESMAHGGTLGMGLLPAWRGQGLGERLLRTVLAASDAYGFDRVQLAVLVGNTRAIALYRKVGFVEEGVRRRTLRIDGVDHDDILMARLRQPAAAKADRPLPPLP